MIVESSFREPGGLASHLLRTDSNESVRLLENLCRDAPLDVRQALRTFAAISATNLRAKNAFVHIVIAPEVELIDGQHERILDLIDEVYRIRRDHPRIIVAHEKGARPAHYHVVLPLVHPETGRAIRSSKNHVHDELVARVAEKEFGHPAVIGAHQAEVATSPLGRRAGLKAPEADSPSLHRQLFGKSERQQMSRVGASVSWLEKQIQQAWAASEGQISGFIACLPHHGLWLAEGRKALLLVDGATGAQMPAARTIRRLAKEQGAPVAINDAMMRATMRGPPLPAFDELQRTLVARNCELAIKAVDAEERLARHEHETEDVHFRDEWLFEVARRRQALKEAKATLTARRAAIREAHALRRELRWARVDRAFAAARWTDNKLVRKFAFRAAAAGVLLCGGGLGLALVAGGIAVSLLPTHERARAMSRAAQIASLQDRAELVRQLAQAFADFQHAKLGANPAVTIEGRLAGLSGAPRTITPSAIQQPQPLHSPPAANSGTSSPAEPQRALPRSIPKQRGGYERD